MLCAFNGTALSRVLPPLLLSEFVLGALGNGLALWIFYFYLKPWKSSTVLLFNLAMADFLLILVLPFRASYYMSQLEWHFGSSFCNVCLFMLAMNRSGSTLFLMAIALDRYMRVVHPHHPVNFLSLSKALCGAAVLWLLAISMSAHIFTLKHSSTTYCESFSINISPDSHVNFSWHKFAFLFSFYVPLVVILYCTVSITSYLRGRQIAQQAKIKKALCFIIVVVVLFIICFLPSNITQVIIWFETNRALQTLPFSQVCPKMEDLTTVFYITISLTYLNSVLDPLVYYFSSPAIKNICRRALHLPQASETVESAEKKARDTGSLSLSQL
ncbi:hydroxycarboxylic acid receptor 2-like [Periophthalmus magnuspinnatus]|uniref:hydroxycarboxylic acid receptor 2-like n=1 Tax=Periophthalmus magnuspinnatus TaxID=409849 RepID=UPI00145B6F0C|nr:hydroxycarboxylic acid receptor 2-like [Periophthalmus magnuspinnatus]